MIHCCDIILKSHVSQERGQRMEPRTQTYENPHLFQSNNEKGKDLLVRLSGRSRPDQCLGRQKSWNSRSNAIQIPASHDVGVYLNESPLPTPVLWHHASGHERSHHHIIQPNNGTHGSSRHQEQELLPTNSGVSAALRNLTYSTKPFYQQSVFQTGQTRKEFGAT